MDDVLANITLAASLPLRFHIIVRSSDPVLDFGSLAPHMLRATHFTLESDDQLTLSRLHQSFKGISGPLLRHFALFFRRDRQNTPRDCTPLLPRSWFSGQLQALEVLHVCCAAMPFADLHLPALRVFRMWGVHRQYSIDFRTLSGVICNSPLLQDVSLRRFTCTGLRSFDTLPVLRSTSVRTLELGFPCDGSLGRLASLFEFPSLSDLLLEISTLGHVRQTELLRPQLLATVASLTISNPSARSVPFDFPYTHLFLLFPCLRALDLSLSHPRVFADLVLTSSLHFRAHAVALLPRLASLTVNHTGMRDLYEFASCYPVDLALGHPCVSLSRIRAVFGVDVPHGPPTMDEAAASSWLASNVLHFDVHTFSSP
ncbi:hypothetical protein B0H16DRAFT_1728911 [Mycena metata]|uniref:Uncharacterized protein n=1 Tax=Mycena metata TaxID=1033252 RepID=A0AAD7IDC7_9AGAR|nr:hypothetical protein B0H16DRAFT_1728911 [Mycena metata]